VPFGLICFSMVTVWYALHGHAPDDVASHRIRARWYTTKTEPSYDDMTIKLRRVIIAARFRGPCPELSRPPRKKPGPSSQPGQPPEHDQQKLRNTRARQRDGRRCATVVTPPGGRAADAVPGPPRSLIRGLSRRFRVAIAAQRGAAIGCSAAPRSLRALPRALARLLVVHEHEPTTQRGQDSSTARSRGRGVHRPGHRLNRDPENGHPKGASRCDDFCETVGPGERARHPAWPALHRTEVEWSEGEMYQLAAITLSVNDQEWPLEVDPRTSLLDALREHLRLTGTKKGCDHGQCGACTVLINGRRINSCLTLAVMHEDDEIVTIEGLGDPERLHPMQAAFVESDGFQCGYCTPGQICSAVGMLTEVEAGWPSHATADVASPRIALTNEEIRERMSGNICRCAAYPNIVAAIREIAGGGPE
jgi:xanthine dehydrogenase YagT iron-sulfur-binding subunit